MDTMSFTSRYLKLPIKIYDKRLKDLSPNGEVEYEDSWIKINPFKIGSWKPMVDEDNNDVECVSVSMDYGDNFYVYLTAKEFEKALNEHAV